MYDFGGPKAAKTGLICNFYEQQHRTNSCLLTPYLVDILHFNGIIPALVVTVTEVTVQKKGVLPTLYIPYNLLIYR